MAVRSSMANLIARTRTLINDPAGGSQNFTDQTIQDVLDAGRADYRYAQMTPGPTWSSGAIQYLDFYAPFGDWEEDYTFSQYYTVNVTPSTFEPISGHFVFGASTFPPVYITGKSYDIYRSAADLLERWASQWLMAYSMMVDGQKLERGEVAKAMRDQAKSFRAQQRARSGRMTRSDVSTGKHDMSVSLKAKPVDFITKG